MTELRLRCVFAAAVARRVWTATCGIACSFTGLVLTAAGIAALNALLVPPARSTLPQRLIYGLGDALVAVVLVVGVVFLVQLVRYLRDRGSEWRTIWITAGNALRLSIERSPTAMPGSLNSHGILACYVTTPDGRTLRLEPFDGSWDGFVLVDAPYEFGAYDVRWYGSLKRGKFYELRREVCIVEADGMSLKSAILHSEQFAREFDRA